MIRSIDVKFYEALDHLSREEVHALVEFNDQMYSDALDSCEYEEARERKARANALLRYLKEQAA